MRKTHFVLLVITVMMALLSAYSLGAINQVYDIEFEWYSEYEGRFSSIKRDTASDKWALDNYPDGMEMEIISNAESYKSLEKQLEEDLASRLKDKILSTDFNKYILMYCTLGEVYLPEYRIKILDIAQRGSVIEVKVSMNSPDKNEDSSPGTKRYMPYDIVLIEKSSFLSRGGLHFIFKTQTGRQLAERYCEIR